MLLQLNLEHFSNPPDDEDALLWRVVGVGQQQLGQVNLSYPAKLIRSLPLKLKAKDLALKP